MSSVRRLAGEAAPPGRGFRYGARFLRRDGTLSFRPAHGGLDVRSLSGTLLVTQERDPEDHVLEPGAVFRACGRGMVAVWALSDASVTVSPAPPGRPERARR